MDANQYGRPRMLLNLEVERLASHVETRDDEFSDLRALERRSESRIVALSEQLSRSQADLEVTSARLSEVAGEIPTDVASLSGQLSRILNAAGAEAEEIRAEAHRYADAVRAESEERAATIIAEADREYEAAATLRADLEAESKQTRADMARLRDEAATNAADIVRQAKEAAEETLTRMQRDIDAQRALAQAKLDELLQVRTNIASQLREFYNKFNRLDGSVIPIDRVEAVRRPSESSDPFSAHGAHAAPEDRRTDGTLRSIG
ncbi:M protein [Mycobacterium sp. 1245805.9]|uniref:M protein n=1 Tax=Mycobacterium sp. 1245805.9 TaxID=1856862 RepID=UPI0012E9D8FC|nr:M protein [Mycobacterium sp. 1245805.9]